MTTNWSEIRGSMRLGVALATIGVAVSVTVVALAAHYVLGLSWELSVLLGACTSATDAAAVFSVLRVVPLPKRLTGDPGGGVGAQRRADRRPGHPDLDRARWPRTARWSWPGSSSSSWSPAS